MYIFADGLTKVTFSNNNIRVTLVQNGPDDQQKDAGTLIIPMKTAAGFSRQLSNSVKQLEEQVKDLKDAQAEARAEARREAEANNQGQGDLH